MERLYTELEKSKYFTKIDCFSGFYQVKLEESSRKYTAFACEWGLFEYQVMPMGLSNSSATFQRLMNIVLHDEIRAGFVVVYIDDILIHSKILEEHRQHVRIAINRLREHMLKVKMNKCEIAKLKVKFLGQEVSEGLIRPSMDRILALFDYQRPTTLKQLQSFLGLAGHYRKYITMFAEKAHPLYELLKAHDVTVKNTKINILWNDEAERSFNEMRQILTSRPLLRLPNFE